MTYRSQASSELMELLRVELAKLTHVNRHTALNIGLEGLMSHELSRLLLLLK